jgi:Tfp pilus assembly protein PilO
MRSNKLLLGVIAVVVAAGAYWMLLLAPKREEVTTLQEQVTQKQAEISQAEAALAGYREAQQSYKVTYAKLAGIGKAVPTDDDVRSLIVQLEDAAGRSKSDFQSFQIAGGAGSGSSADATGATPPPGTQTLGSTGLFAMPLQLRFSGSYDELTNLFTRLERFVSLNDKGLDVRGRLLRIDKMEMTPGAEGYKELTANITATSYLSTPTALPGGDPATSGATTAAGTTPATTTPSNATVTGALR